MHCRWMSCLLLVHLISAAHEGWPWHEREGPFYPLQFQKVEKDSSKTGKIPTPADYADDNEPCQCDLTVLECDIYCCCDPDCTQDEMYSFGKRFYAKENKDYDYCDVPKEKKRAGVRMCSDAVVDHNLPESVEAEWTPDDDNPFVQSLCVMKDNNPSLGIFLEDPGLLKESSDLDATFKNLSEYSFYETMQESSALDMLPGGNIYTIGDRIPVVRIAPDPNDPNPTFYLSPFAVPFYLPRPVYSADCSDDPVLFRHNHAPADCIIALPALHSQCAHLGADKVAHTYFGHTPSAKLPSNAELVAQNGNLRRLQVKLEVRHRSDPSFGVQADAPPPRWNTTGNTCHGVLHSLIYRFFYVGYRLDNVVAEVVLSDIVAPQDASPKVLLRTFGAAFDQLNTSSKPEDFYARRHRSGRPGYRRGMPVLAGKRIYDAGQGTAVLQHKEGLSVLGADLNGRCDLTGGSTESVKFGMDAVFSCLLDFSVHELENWCSGNVDQQGFNNLTKNVYLGILGDADAADIHQWVKVLPETAPPAMSFSNPPGSHICRFVPSHTHLQLFTADVGSMLDPQRKIIAARQGAGKEARIGAGPAS